MAKNYVQHGDVLDLTAPTGGVVAGAPYLIGSIFGVALVSAVAGEKFPHKTVGVWSNMPKVGGTAFSEGDGVYWDNTAKNFTKTATNNKLAGTAVAAAQAADTVATIKIGPVVV